MSKQTSWWDVGPVCRVEPDWENFRHGIIVDSLMKKSSLLVVDTSRYVPDLEELLSQIGEKMDELGAFCPAKLVLLSGESSFKEEAQAGANVWFWANGYLEVSPRTHRRSRIGGGVRYIPMKEPDGVVELDLACSEAAEFEEIRNVLDRNTRSVNEAPAQKVAWLHAVGLDAEGSPGIVEVGAVAAPLIRENYAPEILERYDHIVSEWSKPDPSGKVVVADGVTGSGKTYIIRALMTECPSLFYLLTPCSMLAELAGPELLRLLISIKEGNESRPLVIIVEDADSIVSGRTRESIDALSALLNLGDGLLGMALDVRLIVTTNAPVEQIDAAIMRPRRLLEQLHMEALPEGQCQAIWKRLTGLKICSMPVGRKTLAEVYASASEVKK